MHQQRSGLRDVFQSAYHSTETVLVIVHNDLRRSVDSTGAAILVLLDVFAAFHTIDFDILLSRLQEYYGVRGSYQMVIFISDGQVSICDD